MKKDRKINFKKLTQINQHVKPQPLKTHRSLLEALERRDVIGSLLPFFPGGGLTPSVAKSLNMSMSQAFARLNMGEQKIVADAFETLSAALRDSDVPSPLPPTADDSSAAGSTQSVSSSWDGLSSQGDYVANLASAEDVAIDLSVDLQAESLNFSTDRVANLPSLNSLSSLKGTSVSMQKTPASPTFSAAGNGAPNLDGVRPTPLQTQGSQGNFNSSYQDSSETAAETDQSTAFSNGGSLKNAAAPVAETPNAGAEPSSNAADADAPQANTEKVAFAYDLSDWTVSESGGSEQGRGSVTPIAQGALMAEGDSFVVEMRKTFVMTGEVDALSFAYEASFDASSTGLVKDAFEAALVDSEGYSLVKTFNRSRDSFFNLTEGLDPALGSQTTLSDESGLTRVTLDISSVPVGTECNLVFRLVNNDADAGGWVKIFAEKGQSGGEPEIMPFEVAETVEGAVVSLSADFIDSDAGEAHVATIDWGDGTVEAVAVVPTETGGTVSGEHIYADNGQYEATVSVIDSAGMGAARSTTVAVANAAPEMTDITTSFDGKMNANGTVDQYVVLAGTFTDPGFTNAAAGTEETFVLSVDWGDGTVEEYEPDVTQGGPGVLTVGEYSLRHSYRQGGIYTAVVTVRDDDGGEDAKESKFGYGEIEICLATTYPVVKPSRVKIPVNPSIRHGEIPVIVKSVGNLDATALNVSSVRFYPGDASDSNSQLIAADVDPFADGIADAIFHFSTTDAFIRPTDKIGWLTANFDDGTPFFGFDTIKATPISGAVSEAYDPRTAADSNTRFFVLDGEQDAVYRYTAEGRENSDFVLSDATPDVRDVTANVDGSKLWIVDGISRSVQTRSPDGWLLGAWRAVDVYSPQGIATNGTDIWIVDNLLHGVMRYDGAANLSEGNRTADAFFSLDADNIAPTGMATDGEKIWVSDSYADKIFVYDAFAGNLLGSWSLAPENGFAAGVTNDPTGESDSIWVVDSETLNVYEYAAAAALLTGTAVLAGTFALAEGNTRPVGIVDPAVTTVTSPQNGEKLDVDSTFVVSGSAVSDTQGEQVVAVYVNGTAVDALDVAGNFFAAAQVNPGENTYEIKTVDSNGNVDVTTASVYGVSEAERLSELKFDVSPSFKPDYARTSFDDRIGVLYAQLAIENVGQYAADAPFYVGVRNISDMNVVPLDPVGVTKDGIPYYDVSDSIQGGALNPNDKTLWVDISFLNPGRNRFTYELVYVYKTNEAPVFVTAPSVEAYPGKAYSYASRATDPNRDPLTYSLVVGPDGMTVDVETGDVAWTPTDLGVYSVVLRVEDGRGGSATQTYAINVVEAPENRPPVITSYPPTSATVVNYKQVPGGKIVVAADEWTLSDDGFWNDYEDTATFVENVARWFTDGETGNFLALSENFGLRGDALANVMISNGHQWTGTTETPTLEELLEYDGVFLGGNTVPDNQLLIDYVNAGGCVYLCGGTYNVNETRDWGVFLEAFGLGFYGRINPDGDAWNHIYGVIPIDAKPHPIFENVSALYQRDGHDIVDLDESDSKGVFVATINGMGQYAVYDSAFDVAEAGSGYVYQVEAYEPDGDAVTYSLGLSPEGMWINPNNGAISWAPTVDQIGENVVTVIATDEHGATDTQTYSIMVYADPNNHDPIIISEPATTVIVSEQTSLCDLSDWRQIDYACDDGAPNWILANDNTTAIQTNNANPSILLSDFDVLNREISGSWMTTDYDDDFMGFVFGYQDESHFYLFDWKGGTQGWVGIAERGMSVKRVNSDGTITGVELWDSNNSDAVTTLYHNDIAWQTNVEYTFNLVFKDGEFTITVLQGDVVLDVITLNDDTYKDGNFGFYNFSQGGVYYNGFYQTELGYNYTVVAVDPDDDDITYALLYGPENSSINPQTGELTWITELGSYNFTVLASDGHGGTDVQTFVVNVVEPGSGTISGYIVNDANANGEQDTDEGYLANHVVWLDQNQNGRLDSNEISTKSDANGYYEFTNLPSGAYFVRYQEANGWIQTFPSEGDESGQGGSCGVDPSKNWSFKTPRIYEGNSVCVTTEQDVVDGNDGLVSLREAIQQAEEGDTITFAKELQGKSIVLNGSQLAVTKTIMVDASGIWDSNKNLPGVTIDGNKQSRIFNVESNATLSLVGIKMTNGSSPIGGAIYSYGDLTVSNCSFEGNYAGGTHPPYGGGAISMAKASTLTISSSYFYQNRAYDNGGAIHDAGGVTVVEDSYFEANEANGFYACNCSVFECGGQLSIKNSYFIGNSSTGSEDWRLHGAVTFYGSYLEVDACVFDSNFGQGLSVIDFANKGTEALVKNSVFSNNSNSRTHFGAGIIVDDSVLDLYNCVVIQNSPDYDCPCIRQNGGNVNLYNSIVIGEGVSKTVDSSASINAYNTLSDYQAWSNASNNDVVNYVYDPTQPLFAADGVYLPSEDSQALDKGDNQFVVTDYDICGANRINNGTVDLGPWERIIQSENNDGRFDKKGYVVLLESGQSVTDRNFGATSSEGLDVGALTIVSTPPNTATVGEVYRYDVQTINPSGSVLDFTLLSAPSGMGIHHDLGTIVWRPTNADVGEYQAVVKVRNADGEVATQAFTINVEAANHAPVITTDAIPTPVLAASPYRAYIYAQDADNDALTYSLVGAPDGMTVDPATGVLDWTPEAALIGSTVAATVVVTDARGKSATKTYNLAVVETLDNDAPIITSTPRIRTRMELPYVYLVQAYDPNGDRLTFSVSGISADGTPLDGITCDSDTGLIQWTPSAADQGTATVAVSVSDGRGGVVTQTYALDVITLAENTAPRIISTPARTGIVGKTWRYNAEAVDVDGDFVYWRLKDAPDSASINIETGEIVWVPTYQQLAANLFTVVCTDIYGASTEQTFTVTVRGINRPPVIFSAPNSAAATEFNYVYAVRAKDADGDELRFSLVDGAYPEGMTIDENLGLVRWTPSAADAGLHFVTIQVDDGVGGIDTQTYSINVIDSTLNNPPVITSTPTVAASVGLKYSYRVVAKDPEGDKVTYALEEGPEGAIFNASTGQFEWSPVESDIGNVRIVFTATDVYGKRAVQSYTLTVAPNQAPTIVSTPPTSAVPDAPYSYDVQASDPEGDAITYALVQGPEGMTVDEYGRLRWTPAASFMNVNVSVTVAAIDSYSNVTEQRFTVSVGEDVDAPQVRLICDRSVVKPGEEFTVQVQAIDNVGVASVSLMVNGVEQPLVWNAKSQLYTAQLQFANVGEYEVYATAVDAAGNVGQSDVAALRASEHAELPQVTFHAIYPQVYNDEVGGLVDGEPIVGDDILRSPVITYLTDVDLSIFDDNMGSWIIDFAPVSAVDLSNIDQRSDAYRVLEEGSGVLNHHRVRIDPTILANDAYILRVQAYRTNGIGWVTGFVFGVEGAAKLGQFAFSTTDMSISRNGISLVVQRAYDTARANEQGDFGYGWSLSICDPKIAETTQPGTEMVDGDRVYITTPDGDRIGFTYKPDMKMTSGMLAATLETTPRFEADPGVEWSLACLETPPIKGAGLAEAFLSIANAMSDDKGIFNPSNYVLTSKDGTAYYYKQKEVQSKRVDEESGLYKIVDPNGIELTVTKDGINHSAGGFLTFERDARGRITSITDHMDMTVTYKYDASGDLVAFSNQIDSQSNEPTITYKYRKTPAHFLDEAYDKNGDRVFKAEFDENGRLIGMTDALGNVSQQEFDPGAMNGITRDANGNVTTVWYDDRGNVTLEEKPVTNVLTGETTVYTKTYDYGDERFPDKETRVVDYNGTVTEYVYDDAGNQARISITSPDGTTSVYSDKTYDGKGNVTSETLPGTGTLAYVYDEAGNTTAMTVGDSVVNSAYNDDGKETSATDANGNVTRMEYPEVCPCNAPRKLIWGDGTYEMRYWNRHGAITRVEYYEADGTLSKYVETSYDDLDRKTTEITGQGNARYAVSYEYDGDTDLVAIEKVYNVDNPSENDATYSYYDKAGNLIRKVEPGLNPNDPNAGVFYKYDGNGNVVWQKDPVGNVTTWIYDSMNRVVEERDSLYWAEKNVDWSSMTDKEILALISTPTPVAVSGVYEPSHTIRYAYDGADHIVEKVDQNGRRISYAYNYLGNKTGETWYDETNDVTPIYVVTYGYDENGRMTSAVSPDAEYVLTYNDLGALKTLSVDYPWSANFETFTISYEYDAMGNVVSQTDSSGLTVRSEYNGRNMLSSRWWEGAGVDDIRVDFTYNVLGNITSVTRWADTARTVKAGTSEYTYDLAGRATGITHKDALGKVLADYDYEYDFANRLVEEVLTSVVDGASRTAFYDYDELGQLISAMYDNGQANETFAWDANGNSKAPGAVIGAGNRLLSDGTFNYQYDFAGNMIAKTRINPVAGEANYFEYKYDYNNRLVAVDEYSSKGGVLLHTETYRHDMFGRRVQVVSDGTETISTFDGIGELANEWARFDAAGNVIQRFLFGAGVDRLIAQWTPDQGVLWALTDQLGSVRDLMNNAGAIQAHMNYTAFGSPILTAPNAGFAKYLASHPFAFTGRTWDSLANMSYFRARTFDPMTGRFTSADPLRFEAGDMNLYRYLANSPFMGTDPSGKIGLMGCLMISIYAISALVAVHTFYCEYKYNHQSIIVSFEAAALSAIGTFVALLGALISIIEGSWLSLVAYLSLYIGTGLSRKQVGLLKMFPENNSYIQFFCRSSNQ